jgi:hypothetical protein
LVGRNPSKETDVADAIGRIFLNKPVKYMDLSTEDFERKKKKVSPNGW